MSLTGTLDGHRPRATALIIALAVLAVLAALAITFVQITSTERHAARNHYHATQARLAAQAGIQRALGEIQNALLTKGFLDGDEYWIYRPGAVEEELEDTVTPSFPFDRNHNGVIENGLGGTSTADFVNGRMVSGVIEHPFGVAGPSYNEAYEPNGITYTLRVTDTASQVHLNSRQANLAQFLENLGLAIARTEGLNPIPPGMGAQIVALRESLGGKRFDQLVQLRPLLGPTRYQQVERYLSINAWTDPDTVRPRPLAGRRGRPGATLAIGSTIYAMDELNPQIIESEPRAPINMNSAPEPVLTAVFLGLKGFYMEDQLIPRDVGHQLLYDYLMTTASYTSGQVGRIGTLYESTAIDLDTAARLSADLIARRQVASFKNWHQFHDFIKARGYLDDYQRSAIVANCNPNTNINDYNPPEPLWRPIDKTDLMAYTTELTLWSPGQFTITSLGRVTLLGGKVVARHVSKVGTTGVEILRHTTQKQFMASYLQTGSLDGVFSPSGSRLTSNGTTLESYPEFLRQEFINGAHYDGHLQLATMEAGRPKPVTGPPAVFYARFSDDHDGKGARRPTPFHARNGGNVSNPIPDLDGPYVAALIPGVTGQHPGDLRPDGVYLERNGSIAYRVPGNMSVRHGGFSMWIKPNWSPATTSRPHGLFSVARLWRSGPTAGPADVNPHPWGLWYFPPARPGGNTDLKGPHNYPPPLHMGRMLAWGYGFTWKLSEKEKGGGPKKETDHVVMGILSDTLNHEGHPHSRPNPLARSRWMHVACQWNWGPLTGKEKIGDPGEVLKLWINGVRVPAGNAFANKPFLSPFNPNINFHKHYNGTFNTLRFGEYAAMPSFNFAADVTVDELRTYMVPNEPALADDYRRGRYYNGPGTFYSPQTQFGSTTWVAWLAWTAYFPAELPSATIDVRVYDTRGTGETTDDILVAQGAPADGRLPIGKQVLGLRYEITLTPNGSALQPLLESPVLDDVTIAYFKGLQVTGFREE